MLHLSFTCTVSRRQLVIMLGRTLHRNTEAIVGLTNAMLEFAIIGFTNADVNVQLATYDAWYLLTASWLVSVSTQ